MSCVAKGVFITSTPPKLPRRAPFSSRGMRLIQWFMSVCGTASHRTDSMNSPQWWKGTRCTDKGWFFYRAKRMLWDVFWIFDSTYHIIYHISYIMVRFWDVRGIMRVLLIVSAHDISNLWDVTTADQWFESSQQTPRNTREKRHVPHVSGLWMDHCGFVVETKTLLGLSRVQGPFRDPIARQHTVEPAGFRTLTVTIAWCATPWKRKKKMEKTTVAHPTMG